MHIQQRQEDGPTKSALLLREQSANGSTVPLRKKWPHRREGAKSQKEGGMLTCSWDPAG
jgi:hypothetical protein